MDVTQRDIQGKAKNSTINFNVYSVTAKLE